FLSPIPSYIKTGAKYMTEDRFRTEHSDQYNFVGPKTALANTLETGYSYDAAGRHYPIFYLDTSKVDALRISNPTYFTTDPQLKLRNDLLNDQQAQERVLAGYFMGGADLGRLSILAGIRVEKTNVSGTSALQDAQAAVGIVDPTARTMAQYGRRTTVSRDYMNVLPGIHFKYGLGQSTQMRASYSASFGRPSFGSIYPATNINYTAERITQNNPALKPQEADNFDITLEHYFEPVGLISAGVFLKEISNFLYSSIFPIASGNDNGFGGDYAGWTLATQANGGFGRVRGFELNYSQQLSFLPGALRGFGIFANYTYLETFGTYGRLSGGATGDLAQFTPRVLNGGLSYSRRKFSGRIYANCIGRYLEGWNANPLQLEYTLRRTIADLNLTYGLSRALTVTLDVNNIFNSKFRRVAGPFDYRVQTRESNATRITLGISGRH
ncbi:MAG: TonB-dependent receptor, partial [Opitutus sp.]|nr:TonB-dependent receptor [Opitutus sp.]